MPTVYKGSEEERRALNAYIKFTRASNSLEHFIARQVAAHGLTLSQVAVLETIYHLGPMCQSEIGKKILKTGGNITMVIDALEKKGLVQRVKNEQDRRFYRIVLTKKGEEFIKEYFPKHVKSIMQAMSGLNENELDEFGRLAKKLGTHISE